METRSVVPQPSAEGDEPVLGGRERGGGAPASSGGVVGTMGRAAGADAGSDGERPAHHWDWDPPECLAELKRWTRGRRIDTTIKEETL